MRRIGLFASVALTMTALAGTGTAAAQQNDPAGLALNILPSGQYGVPGPGASEQAEMYDALTPLFDDVTSADLTRYFKSEALGIGTDGPTTEEQVPFRGVTILRDRFNVPHVYADTYSGGVLAAGWIAARDRGLLLEQARYNGRAAAIDVPGVSAIGLIANLENFRPSARAEAQVAKQTQALKAAGKEGRAVLRDIDTFIKGINAYLDETNSTNERWTRNDVYAVNAVKNQFLGVGGGDEARRARFLGGLQERLGARKGKKVFDDLRQFRNPGSTVSVDGRFPYGRIPKRAKGSVVLDPGSFQTTYSSPVRVPRHVAEPFNASNVLMVDARRSTTGHPIMVGGPQISYFFPGLTYEIDMHAPGLNWRGATSAPFPGYLLIGRGRGFATTLTSAGADVIDQYAETLCGGSDTRYRFRGRCRTMGTYDAGTLNGEPVTFKTTVHGPVVGYATVNGRRVAISQKRSSLNKDVLDLLFNRRLSNGQVRSAKTFIEAASKTPQTFNSFYIDARKIAVFTSGLLPKRHPAVDPGLPTKGTGNYEWRGFLSAKRHPQAIGADDGTIVNWNNGLARGFGAADDDWGRNGSATRNDILTHNMARLREAGGKWSPASLTAAMNAGATQDVRAIVTVPLLARLLQGTPAPSAQAQEMLDLLVAWRAAGGSRLDVALDGEIDHPGAAIMDVAYPRIAENVMAPLLQPQLPELDALFGVFDQPPGGQYSGWYQYMDRDLRALLRKKRQKDEFRIAYCGKGDLAACRASVWVAMQAAADELAAEQGTADPSSWRADATGERIDFTPLPLIEMRYANRPSGIQQVIWFRK
jgi:acyl-homoserine lactone acylase PvdQ